MGEAARPGQGPADGAIVVAVGPRFGQRDRCRRCRRRCPGYDLGGGRRCWRALDLGTTFCLLEADAPRVECKRHRGGRRDGAVGQARLLVHDRVRGPGRVARGQHVQEGDLRADANLVADRRADLRAGVGRPTQGPRPAGRRHTPGVRRDLGPQGSAIPHGRRGPSLGPADLGARRPGPQDGREVPGSARERAMRAGQARLLRRRRVDHPTDLRALPERHDLPGPVSHRQGRDRRA